MIYLLRFHFHSKEMVKKRAWEGPPKVLPKPKPVKVMRTKPAKEAKRVPVKQPRTKLTKKTSLSTLLTTQKEVNGIRKMSHLHMDPQQLQTGIIDGEPDIFKLSEPTKEREERRFQHKVRETLLDIYDRGTGFGPLMPQGHFTHLLVARRFSGKSTFLNAMMKAHWVSMRVRKDGTLQKSEDQFFKIKVLCSPTAGKDKSLDHNEFTHVFTKREEMEALIQKIQDNPDKSQNGLLVLDDVQEWVNYQAHSLISWFCTVNRHYGWSVAISVQNLKQGLSPSIRNNLSQLTTFRIPLAAERKKIEEEIGSHFMQMYDMVDWSIKYQYCHLHITKGPTLWYFQGISKKPKNDNKSLLTPNFNFSWKFIARE